MRGRSGNVQRLALQNVHQRMFRQSPLSRRVQAGQEGSSGRFLPYRFDPNGYIRHFLGWEPWAGVNGNPGQQEVLEQMGLAMRALMERRAYEKGELAPSDLRYWQPGETIRSRFRIEAGHTVGKTRLASGAVSWFFDCYSPSVVYTFAPTYDQIKNLLWKEIRADRRGKDLPGRILDVGLRRSDKHFALGKATSSTLGGTERVHGQHNEYMFFLFDEAEGVADYVWDAVESMLSGGIALVLMLANPRTRSSRFYRMREHPEVASYRFSCLDHPNVVSGQEIVATAVRREYVLNMISQHCEVSSIPQPDGHSFSTTYPVVFRGEEHPPGTEFLPDGEFQYRVMGIAPSHGAGETFISYGRYEETLRRQPVPDRPELAWMGVDCAGYGGDMGTLYIRHNGRVWRAYQMSKADGSQDPTDYWLRVRESALALREQGVERLQIRIDAGGGFGNGLYDRLKRDEELLEAFCRYADPLTRRMIQYDETRLLLQMVHFGARAANPEKYLNLGTQLYAEAAETMGGITLVSPPQTLEDDLCGRKYTWVNSQGVDVRKLEDKTTSFRKRHGRSPDDGDGFVLCVAPDFLFRPQVIEFW